MCTSAFIADGYEKDCYIEGKPNLYPSCRFTIRPMTTIDRSGLHNRLKNSTGVTVEYEAASCVVKHLSGWNLTNGDGNTAKIDRDQILKLQPAMFARIYDCVLGHDGGDPDPDAVPGSEDKSDAGTDSKN